MIFPNHDLEHITGLIKPVRSEKSWGDFKGAAFPTNTHARGFSVPIRAREIRAKQRADLIIFGDEAELERKKPDSTYSMSGS